VSNVPVPVQPTESVPIRPVTTQLDTAASLDPSYGLFSTLAVAVTDAGVIDAVAVVVELERT
jgi:hypothetical protein